MAKVRSSSVRQNVIVSFMVVIAILTVNLRRGIFLLDVTVLNQAITSSRRKYVVVANKSSVVTKSVTTKNLLLNKESYLKLSLGIVFLYFIRKTDTFLKFVFYTNDERKESKWFLILVRYKLILKKHLF